MDNEIYRNALGERIALGTTIYYYAVTHGEPELKKTCTWDMKYGCMGKYTTEIGKTPASALLLLNEYYKEYGYPEQ